jgi:hypothetical protein
VQRNCATILLRCRGLGGLAECARKRAQGLGYTPVNARDWDDAQEFLEKKKLPALRQAVGGTNVTATRARFYRRNTTSWSTVVELTYKGKQWEGTENGHWVDCHFLMMTFSYAKGGAGARYARANAEGVIPRFNVDWGGARNLCGWNGRLGYKQCKIGYPAWDEFADRVLAIKTTGGAHQAPQIHGQCNRDRCELPSCLPCYGRKGR